MRPPHETAECGDHALLTDRQAYILSLVVHDYVQTAQPVGSEMLVTRHALGVSAATVRNELARLEAAGLLSHPHTSAGRMPTVSGYRYFVENLMSSAGLTVPEQRTIRHQFHQAGGDSGRWMRLSAAVMAHTSGAAGLVAADGDGRWSPRFYHAGLTQILDEPEFSDYERLRDIVEILEHGQGLGPITSRLPLEGVHVIIGGEPPLEDVPHVTLVLARFGATQHHGILGVVGPTRLPYDRAVPAVSFVASLMTELLAGDAA